MSVGLVFTPILDVDTSSQTWQPSRMDTYQELNTHINSTSFQDSERRHGPQKALLLSSGLCNMQAAKGIFSFIPVLFRSSWMCGLCIEATHSNSAARYQSRERWAGPEGAWCSILKASLGVTERGERLVAYWVRCMTLILALGGRWLTWGD